jgi:flagellar biosynthetic protein FlhB
VSASGGGEKTEKPTAKRKKESRKEGQVARTPDLGGWITVLVLGMAMPVLLTKELTAWSTFIERCLRLTEHPSTSLALSLMHEGASHVFWTLLTLCSIVMVIGIASALAQGGFALATKQVKPSAKKLNLITGFKRIFGPQAVWEGAKILIKSTFVAVLVYVGIRGLMPLVGGLVPIAAVLEEVRGSALGLMRNIAIAGLVMAAADYAMQRRRIGKQTRMSKEEVKQEYKQSEGDPMLKSAIRSRQLATSRNRMMADIATADVVLVNPTHVAVALRYEPSTGAPRVVARGAGAVAAKIRERAAEERIPLVRDIPLARALYSSTQVGQAIPSELFVAVASVLAFVISRRTVGSYGGEHRSPRTETELPEVPAIGRRRRNASTPVPAGR